MSKIKANNQAYISILIVNFNSSDFIGISLYALSKLTKACWKAYILDNGSKIKDYKNLKRIVKAYDNVILERQKTNLRGSTAHGSALNYLISKVNTPYFSILDADATWLIKNWDEILINQLNDKVKVIGTQAPVGSKKYQDFPLMFAIFFETETFKKLNIDFRPKDPSQYQDTGWELREKYLLNGFKGKIIAMKNTRNYKKGPFRNVICGEYYLNGHDHIFASHFGRGSSLGENKYYRGTNFLHRLPFLGKIFRSLKGKQEKQRWIEICKKIVDEQI